MATFFHTTFYSSLGDEYQFPVVKLGDLTNKPDGSNNEHGVWCGMCTSYSSNFTFKSEEGGRSPAHLALSNTIRSTLNLYGIRQGTFYPDPEHISSGVYFSVHLQFIDHPWLNYVCHCNADETSCSDRGGWTDDDFQKINVCLGLATINGHEYLGLYYDGYDLGPDESDTWSGWTFAYQEDPNDAWNVLASMLNIEHSTMNPYAPGGYSGEGGGDSSKQNFGDASDFVNPDAMPDESTIGAVDSGLLTIFTPSKAQLGHLSSLLWSNDFFSFVEKSLTGIEDLFVSLGIVPFVVTSGATAVVTWLNYSTLGPAQIPTSVQLTKAASQFMEFNMGNVSLTGNDNRMFASDSVLDYSPYSRLGIYLPFIGYQELDIDECREKTINLKYRIDILSGACVALISINGRTLYQFSGNCITQIPLTSADYSQAINTAVNVGIAATSMGTSAALASAGDALTSSKAESGKIDATMGDYQNAQHAAMVSNAENSLAGATANGFMGMKPNFKKTGAISGSTGLLSVKQPYLCLTTPRQSMPEGYEKVCGFPCNMGGKLGNFSGYTVVEDIRLNGLVATSPEVEEIYKLLKSGVII